MQLTLTRTLVTSFLDLFRIGEQTDARRSFRRAVTHIIGERPANVALYQLAVLHTSASRETPVKGFRESNERLEYLGDAVLGMIIAEFLFKKYPYKDEGFLTEVRSRLVNREALNGISRKIGLDLLIQYDGSRTRSMPARTSMYGDALEAFLGAIYLDKGFAFTQRFILGELLAHFDVEAIAQTNSNFKSRLIEWAQRQGKDIRFEILEEKGNSHFREFIAQVMVSDEPFATGSGYSKKKAEQAAAEKAFALIDQQSVA